MSDFISSWSFRPGLFFLFFQTYPAAQKFLAAALTGLPPSRLLSAVWYPGSTEKNGFCLRVRTDQGESFVLEILPCFDGALSTGPESSPSPLFHDLLFDDSVFNFSFPKDSLFPFHLPRNSSVFPHISSPKPGAPQKFLRIFLIFQDTDLENPFFYGSFSLRSSSFRVLNLSALQPFFPDFPDLYALSRLLLSRHSSKLPSLARKFPVLSSVAPLLEDLLRENELRALFQELSLFSPEDSLGISAMCSVNRLLLREKRFDELQKVSDDPEALRRLFLDFREKGILPYKKDPCRLHRSQEKREKYI